MNRRQSIQAMATGVGAILFGGAELAACAPGATSATSKKMVVYKSPTCGCCGNWIKHVEAAGYQVEAIDVDDVTPYKKKHGVPLELSSCHTGVIDGYAVEGHVPADLIDKLLKEKPQNAKALAVPGMPLGSPGMEVGGRKDAYDVLLIDKNGKSRVYAKR
jgi:hypothetical protein